MADVIDLNLDNLTPEEKEFKAAVESAGIPTTEEGLTAQFQQIADESQLVITNTSAFSPFWCLIKALVTKPVYWLICFLIRYTMPNLYLKTASGFFVDLIAYTYDLTRKPAAKALGNITFTRTAVSAPMVIPGGTKIRTVAINGNIYRMITLKDTPFEAGSKTLLVEAEAEAAGEAYNLADGYYSILEEPIAGVESVVNGKDWLTSPGADIEEDADFKARVQNQFTAVADWHIDSKYRAMMSTITGIRADQIYFDHDIPRGPGSADAYILFDTYTPGQTFIDTINNYINVQGNHGHGDSMLAKVMPGKDYDLTVTLHLDPTLTIDQTVALKAVVEQMIKCSFRENSDYDDLVSKTWAYARFAFSKLDQELHNNLTGVLAYDWSLDDIVSDRWVPRLGTLTIIVAPSTTQPDKRLIKK